MVKSHLIGKLPLYLQSLKKMIIVCHKTIDLYHLATSTASKILEHYISSHVMEHLEHNHILYELQYGFHCNRYCKSQLIINDLTKSYDADQQSDVIC